MTMSDDKNDIEFDDDEFGIDGLDDGGYAGSDSSDGKTSARKVAKEVVTSAVDNVLNRDTAHALGGTVIRDALPKGYSAAVTSADKILTESSKTLKEASKELSGAKDSLKAFARDNEEKINKILPKGLADKVKAASTSTSSRNFTLSQEQQAATAAADVFAKLEDYKKTEYNLAKDKADDAKDTVYQKASIGTLASVSTGINALVSYQNNVLAAYQKKDLEIKYRQLFMIRDLLDVTKAQTDITQQQLNNIIKNTALPDSQKIRLTEAYGEQSRNSIIGSLNAGLASNTTNTVRNMASNAKQVLLEKVAGLNDSVSGAVDMASMAGDAGGGGSLYSTAASMAGGAAAAKLVKIVTAKIVKYVKGKASDDPNIQDGSADLMYLVNNYSDLVNEWARGSDGIRYRAIPFIGGWLDNALGGFDSINNFARDLVTTKDNKRSIGGTLQTKATDIVDMDTMMRRSWVEIIPGYLSRILEQVTNISTGTTNDRVVYSTETESFVTVSDHDNAVASKLFNADNIQKRIDDVMAIVDGLDKDKELSEAERLDFARQLLADRDAGLVFKPERYIYAAAFGDSPYGEKLSRFVVNTFDNNKTLRTDTADKLRNVAIGGNELDAAMQLLSTTGELDTFTRLGIASRTSNGLVFDDDAVSRIMSGMDTAPIAMGTDGTVIPPTTRIPNRPKTPLQATGPPSMSTGTNTTHTDMSGLRKDMADCCATTHDLLRTINTSILASGTGTSGTGDGGPISHVSPNGAKSNLFSELGTSALSGIRGIGKGYMGVITGAGDAAFGALRAGKNAIMGIGDKVATDIYIGNESQPRLRKVAMEAGQYIDGKTGQVIKSLADIKGEVKDLEGNVLISADELTDMHRLDGTLLSSILGTGFSITAGALSSTMGLYGTVGKLAMTGGSKALALISNKANDVKDIYVKGTDTPALRAIILRNGGYLSGVTGKAIASIKDIDGPVKDTAGNIVLSGQDIIDGLVDVNGIKADITSAAGYMASLAGRAVGAGYRMGKSIVQGAGSLASSGISAIGGLVNGLGGSAGSGSMGNNGITEITRRQDTQIAIMRALFKNATGLSFDDVQSPLPNGSYGALKWDGQIANANAVTGDAIDTDDKTVTDVSSKAYLSEILDVLRDDDTKVKGDSDNDGVRDNSVMDIIRRRKAKAEKDKDGKPIALKDDNVKDDSNGLLTMIAGMASSIGGTLTAGFSTLATTIGGLLAGKKGIDLATAGAEAAAAGGVAGGNGKKGMFRRMAGAIKNKLTLGNVKKGGKIGLALAAIVGSAKAISSGMDFFSYNSKVEPLEGLRFMEYGVDLQDSMFVKAVRKLESMALDNIKWSGNIPTIEEDDGYFLSEIAATMGVIVENAGEVRDWQYWWNRRFKVVFLTHLSVLRSLDDSADLDDIDDDLDAKYKREFILRTRYNNADKAKGINPYIYTNSPMHGVVIPSGSGDINRYVSRLLDVYTATDADTANTLNDTFSPAVASSLAVMARDSNKPDTRPVAKPSLSSRAGDAAVMAKDFAVDGLITTAGLAGGAALLGGSGLANAAGIAALSTTSAVSSAAGVGGAALGMVTLPGVVIAGAVAGIGYGAYKAYDYFSKRADVEPLEALRFMEYGISVKDYDAISSIRALESLALGAVNWRGSTPALDMQPMYFLKEIAPGMGVSLDDTKAVSDWMYWFTKRFSVIFLTHLRVLKSIDDTWLGTDLDDLDDELDDTLKKTFILRTRIANLPVTETHPYSVINTPIPGTPITDNRVLIAAYVKMLLQQLKETDELDIDGLYDLLPNKTKQKETKAVIAISKQSSLSTSLGDAIAQHQNAVGTSTTDTTQTPANKAAMEVANTKMAAHVVPGKGKGILVPVEGRLSSKFGLRTHPVTGKVMGHKGLDFAAPTGTPIYAAADGIVFRRYRSKTYGNVIYLNHDDGKATRYAHMVRFADKNVGDRVAQGDILGYVGSTGRSTGPHLHFEYRDGQAQKSPVLNPVDYFKGSGKKVVDEAIKEAENFVKEVNTEDKDSEAEGTTTLGVVAGNVMTTTTGGNAPVKPKVDDGKSVPGSVIVTDITEGNVPAKDIPGTSSIEKPIGDLITVQGRLSDEAKSQRDDQISIQRETLDRLDKLIQAVEQSTSNTNVTLSGGKDIDPTTAKRLSKQASALQTAKSTKGVLSFDH